MPSPSPAGDPGQLADAAPGRVRTVLPALPGQRLRHPRDGTARDGTPRDGTPGYPAAPSYGTGRRPARDPALAEWWQRLLARLVDDVILIILTSPVWIAGLLPLFRRIQRLASQYPDLSQPAAAQAFNDSVNQQMAGMVGTFLLISAGIGVISFGYDWLQHGLWGQTIGKRVMGTKVVTADTRSSISGQAACGRAAVYALVPVVPLGGRPVRADQRVVAAVGSAAAMPARQGGRHGGRQEKRTWPRAAAASAEQERQLNSSGSPPELADDLVTVARPAGFHLEQHLHLIHPQPGRHPLMHDIQHVGAQARQFTQQRRQRAGPVGDPAPEHQVPPGRGQAVPQHLGEQQRIDVAARQHRYHRWLERLRMLQQRRDPRRAGRLDDLLGPLQAEQQRPRQALLGDGDAPGPRAAR